MKLEYFLIVVLALAGACDTAHKKVPNHLVLTAFFVALIVSFFSFKSGGVARIEGMVCMAILWIPLWRLNLIGGGDHKALILVGALFGIKKIVLVSVLVAVFGGIISSACIVMRLVVLRGRLSFWGVAKNTPVPYALSIFAGTLFLWLAQLRG